MVRQSNGSAGASIQCECPQGVEPCRSISALRTALTVATPSLPRDPAKVPSPSHLRTLLIVAKPAADSRPASHPWAWRAWLVSPVHRSREPERRASGLRGGSRAVEMAYGLPANRLFRRSSARSGEPSPALPDARPSPRPCGTRGRRPVEEARRSPVAASGRAGASRRRPSPETPSRETASTRDPASLDPSY